MNAQLREEARRAFNAARIAHSGAVTNIAPMARASENRAEEIRTEIRALDILIEETQSAHNRMQGHVNKRRAIRKKSPKTAKRVQSNLRRRDQHGAKAKELRIQRRVLEVELEDVLSWPKSAERLHDLHGKRRSLYAARHLYLMAVMLSEVGDATALERKRHWMRLAEIPAQYAPDDVWYYDYEYIGEHFVHLFYGGTTAPMGEGCSPDGDGHGHVVLVLTNNGHFIKNTRPPIVE